MRLMVESAEGIRLTFASSRLKLTNYVTFVQKRDVLRLDRGVRLEPQSREAHNSPARGYDEVFHERKHRWNQVNWASLALLLPDHPSINLYTFRNSFAVKYPQFGARSEGFVASIVRSLFFRGLVAFVFASTALLVAYYGFLLLTESVNGHGSFGGNAVLLILGLILLVLSLSAFIFGVVYWTSSSRNSDMD
jgi:hypothetical protein